MTLVLDPPPELAARTPPECSHGPCLLFERDSHYYYACSASRDHQFCSFVEPAVSGDGSNGPSTRPTLQKRKHANENLAQYYFSDETVRFVLQRIIQPLHPSRVLCLGCPSIFRAILEEKDRNLTSLLLDLDHRYRQWCPDDRFVRFNMFNGHFFESSGSQRLQSFLSGQQKVLLLVDPPFGGLVQCLAQTLARLREQFCGPDSSFSVVLFFPYFNEHWIRRAFHGSLRITDFIVTYENHAKFRARNSTGGRTLSPVRIFTDLDLGDFADWHQACTRYRWCSRCSRTVFARNRHCAQCGQCTARDAGKTTWHCAKCARCCKSTWKHCARCDRCHEPKKCKK